MRAITGAAPVPVPPPMPAVMKTMCAAVEVAGQLLRRLLRGGAADLGLGAGAEALRQVRAELHAALGAGVQQRLRVGVGHDELHAVEAHWRSCC